jgi:hypothetical protein
MSLSAQAKARKTGELKRLTDRQREERRYWARWWSAIRRETRANARQGITWRGNALTEL